MVQASGVAVFGPLQFRAGRACYACALGRSCFGRAAAPHALGPSIMPRRVDRGRPPWACYALRGPALDLPGPLELERVSLGRWTVSRCARPACTGSPDAWPGPPPLDDLRPPGPAPAAPPLGRASAPPGPWPGPHPPGPPLPVRISPPAPAIFPQVSGRDFPP